MLLRVRRVEARGARRLARVGHAWYRLDVSDARRELGMDTYWIDTEKTVQDHMSWMIQQGFLTDKGKRIKG